MVDRARAIELTEGVLERLVEGRAQWPLSLVRELYVFGSVARGALKPHDVDLDVEFDRDDQWRSEVSRSLSERYDPCRVFRQALTGRRRSVDFAFDCHADADFDMTLLWRRGDDLPTAMARLHSIKPDPAAGRAERHAMLPEFDGMERWLPRYYREQIIEAIESGAVRVERLVLDDHEIEDSLVREHLHKRWQPTSPLYRAGQAVFGNLLDRGIDPGQLILHGQNVRDNLTPYFAGFGLCYFRGVKPFFLEYHGVELIEVVHPTRVGEIRALRFLPDSLPRLKEVDWR
ncbi:hypothetical protein ODJ79_43935 [Actinoplanes sp. KI2]|uniref:nucleotidyltransferase domain-containing protein n=1 Tax=Actinoplanes sp. KI2 TaxID=2983315 RepID=UPI0021D57569|nr:nucleotidyltransferase domain-containing protein [Actinoplanes sp. KI2]MCU7730710.1 hypothetical protein [Actinoplanes sp. KI2]